MMYYLISLQYCIKKKKRKVYLKFESISFGGTSNTYRIFFIKFDF